MSHDENMNALVLRIGTVLDGQDGFDAACACALAATFALHKGFDDLADRKKALQKVVVFMQDQLNKMSAS
jgi:hypothetical protein